MNNVNEKLKTLAEELLKLADELGSSSKENTTSTGHKWVVENNKALDVATGLKWDIVGRGDMNYNKAVSSFNTTDCRLPSKEEWLEAASHGITEVIPEIINNRHWTASVYSVFPDNAWDFYAHAYGGVEVSDSSRGNDAYAVRCVGR